MATPATHSSLFLHSVRLTVFLLDPTIRRRFTEREKSEEKTIRIDSPGSHYTLDWILDYLKVAEGQAPACSLLALNDFNTQHCIRQLLQSPVHTPATTPLSRLLFTTAIKLEKKKKKKPASWGLAPDHSRQTAAPFWVNRSVSAVQDGYLENHPSRWNREPWDAATPQSITAAFLLTLTSLNYPREHDSSPCLPFLFFWVSDMTFRCFGDNYRKREIELLAFFFCAGTDCVGVVVKCSNYLAKLAYYIFRLLLQSEL